MPPRTLEVRPGLRNAVAKFAESAGGELTAQDFVETLLFRAHDIVRALDCKPSELESATAHVCQVITEGGYDLPVAMDYPNRRFSPAPKR